ncbi:MAG: aminopeptidase P family protein [Salinivirgaceae bacterium]|nr:aminopeptidase P family protein [Salinivirgaceae bacterium]
MFAKGTYIARRAKLRAAMGNKGIAVFYGNSEASINYADNTYPFRQDSTFLYFFGIRHPNMVAVIDFDSGNTCLYGNDADIDDIVWTGPQYTMSSFGAFCGVDNTAPMSALRPAIAEAKRKGRKVHYLPPYTASVALALSSDLEVSMAEMRSQCSLELIKAVIDLRAVKSDEEIAEIERACAIGYEMHTAAMRLVRTAANERAIHSIVDSIPLKYGGTTSFTTILTQNGQTLHNHLHDKPITPGRLMLVDAGAETPMGYASDFTRTFPVSGQFTQRQRDIYQIVLDANHRALELSRPGVTYQTVHLECCKVLAAGLKALGLMRGDVDEAVAAGAHALFMPHGIGHMMGLDVHDMENLGQIYVGYNAETQPIEQFGTKSLRMGRKLQPGFVVTDEPGIYFIPELFEKWRGEHLHEQFINYAEVAKYLDFGGIRIEDDLLITANGARRLGERRIPAEIADVEAEMQKTFSL